MYKNYQIAKNLNQWVDGSPNLNGSSFVLLWVLLFHMVLSFNSFIQIYLVFMNGLWVVLPALLLWDSFAHVSMVGNMFSLQFSAVNVKFVACRHANSLSMIKSHPALCRADLPLRGTILLQVLLVYPTPLE